MQEHQVCSANKRGVGTLFPPYYKLDLG